MKLYLALQVPPVISPDLPPALQITRPPVLLSVLPLVCPTYNPSSSSIPTRTNLQPDLSSVNLISNQPSYF